MFPEELIISNTLLLDIFLPINFFTQTNQGVLLPWTNKTCFKRIYFCTRFKNVFSCVFIFGIPAKLDPGRMACIFGLWTAGRLDSGRLDAWVLDVWTLDAFWKPGRLDSGRLDAWTLDGWTQEILSIVSDN